jgi:hypothetical protein
MKFQPITKRFRVPCDTSNDPLSLIVLTQDENGVVELGWSERYMGTVLFPSSDNDRPTIAALGFPVNPPAEVPDPPVETLIEVTE